MKLIPIINRKCIFLKASSDLSKLDSKPFGPKITEGPEPEELKGLVGRMRNKPMGDRQLPKNIGRSKSFSNFTADRMASNEMASKGMKFQKNGQPNNETRNGGMKKNIETKRSNRGGGKMSNKTAGKKNLPNGRENVRGETFSKPQNGKSEMENARKNNFSNMVPHIGKASNVVPKDSSDSTANFQKGNDGACNAPRFNPFRRGVERTERDDFDDMAPVNEHSKENRFNPFRRGIERTTDVIKSDYPNWNQGQRKSNLSKRKDEFENRDILNNRNESSKENYFSNQFPRKYGTSNKEPLHDMNFQKFQVMPKLSTNNVAERNGSTLRKNEPTAIPPNLEEYSEIKAMPEFWWKDSKDDEYELSSVTSKPLPKLDEKNGEAIDKPAVRGLTRSKTCPSFSIDREASKAVTTFIYGKDIVQPMVSWTDTAPFDAKMKRHLGIGPIITQTFSFAWPHLMEQKSLILIDISNGANAYLPTVCTIVQVSDYEI